MIALHQLTAAIYLAAGIGSLLGMALPAPRIGRGAVWGLGLGVVLHILAFASLHAADPMPPLTDLPVAVSLMAGMGNIGLLLMMGRHQLRGLTAVAGPVSFLAVFFAALQLPHAAQPATASGSWPHAHVMLSSAGLALLGIAGIAGGFFLLEHRRLKSKRPVAAGLPMPSLEALDRVNRAALSVGFPLLTLGVITGVLWIREMEGALWTGSAHQIWSAIAWGLYAGLVAARFAGNQGARQAAASALAGAGFLVFAVVGVGMVS